MFPTALWVALVASALLFAGTLLPWVSFLGLSRSGTDTGDGKLVLILSFAAAASVVATRRWGRMYIFTALIGLASLATSLYDSVDISGSGTKAFGERIGPSVGSGLILDVIASVALVVAVAWHVREIRRQPAAPPVE
jgi:hypothetical protein